MLGFSANFVLQTLCVLGSSDSKLTGSCCPTQTIWSSDRGWWCIRWRGKNVLIDE
jgi:hypothetical protein